jgi:hypothetical protein
VRCCLAPVPAQSIEVCRYGLARCTRCVVQIVLGEEAGGLLFVSAECSFRIAFPWVASRLIVNCVTAEPFAVLAEATSKAGGGREQWLHFLAPDLKAQASPCAFLHRSVHV